MTRDIVDKGHTVCALCVSRSSTVSRISRGLNMLLPIFQNEGGLGECLSRYLQRRMSPLLESLGFKAFREDIHGFPCVLPKGNYAK